MQKERGSGARRTLRVNVSDVGEVEARGKAGMDKRQGKSELREGWS
jgi:hypothetical protein